MNISETDFQQFLEALRFSAARHSGQKRKDKEASPYINHPIEVTEILWRVGKVRHMPTLLAALLHDTIEDTGTRPEEIRTLFGDEVLALVQEVTDDKNLPKHERKRLQVINAPHKSLPARQIKLADKISNVRDITHTPPADWSLQRKREYLEWTAQVIAGLRGPNPELEACYDQVLAEGWALLDRESRGENGAESNQEPTKT
jgi:guanosine-3',5'-bis(diphosphate) 3'-pyrophosphohydrolase